ncbi:cytochrome c oxidase subunit 3 [Gammaproteobacteria bacterium]|nr:cytochrome c oxidase subunit 3 [Gammaproteobacteria bacterium]
MSTQTYYVPEQSRFPIFMAVSLFLLVMGASSTINNLDNPDSKSSYILYAGLASLFTTMFFWFRQIIKEHLAGLDSNQLKTSYVYGMAWFIFSEVMFFAAFFGALFYVRNFAVPWLSGEGENGVGISALGLWEGFESSWPVMITPDKGAEYVLAEKSLSWPGWVHALEWLPLWNTIVLLSSSVTVHFAHLGLKNGDKKKFHLFLGITVGLALIFVGLQAAEYYEAYEHYGLTLNSGIYGSTFFMLTGFHGFHVMMGGLMLAIMLARSVFAGHFDDHDHFGFEAASWYWHFVDVVWVMLFLFVYIL